MYFEFFYKSQRHYLRVFLKLQFTIVSNVAENKPLVPEERIAGRILLIRDVKIMLDFHLADLYGIETRVLKQAVKRNIERFPSDFMFVLNEFFSYCSSLNRVDK